MKNDKKIAIFGCKSTSKYLIDFLHPLVGVDFLITINEEKGEKFQVADYYPLGSYAREKGIQVYEAQKYSLKSEEDFLSIASFKIDLAFVAGWQRIIPGNILQSIKIGAFGMHGSAMNLPLGRGRSPMNWSIIEGRKVFYTNLFKYDAGIDSGQLLDTLKFTITDKDTCETMHFKNILAMRYLITKNIEVLIQERYQLNPQKDILPSYYPKRMPSDSLIDWEDDIHKIERLIRAVTRPFNGAYSFIKNLKISIFSAQILDMQEFGYEQERTGTILEIFPNGKFIVKGFGGLLLVHDYSYPEKIKAGWVLNNGPEQKKHFKTNKFGFFDIYDYAYSKQNHS